jgi:predicted dehydrogenase
MSRRSFLKKGAATTLGALAVPALLPSAAWGAAGGVAPSERITLGIIGLGMLGTTTHLPAFLGNPDVQIVAACDVERKRLLEAQSMTDAHYTAQTDRGSYKSCAVYGDFRELLARDDIDAVVIVTPDHWHAAISVAAAKAGKDIYCEKPMSHDIAEGRVVADVMRRYGRIYQTGSQQRSEYDGMFRRAVELVQAGAIGELKSIDVGVNSAPHMDYDLAAEPLPDGLDWDMWLGPAPYRPYNAVLCPMVNNGWPAWRNYREFGSGYISDMGAHHFDIAQWAMGMDDSGPVEITPPNGKDIAHLTFRYANGVTMHDGGATDNIYHGTEGKIYVSRDAIRTEPEGILETRIKSDGPQYNRGMGHREDWIQCIKTRQRPIADAEIGHRSATICHLAVMAYRLDRPLQWDPQAESFINDDEANRLRSRPMRSPWHL